MKKPKKLSKNPSKKLSARARRKELTGVNLVVWRKHEAWVKEQIRMIDVNLERLWARVLELGHDKK